MRGEIREEWRSLTTYSTGERKQTSPDPSCSILGLAKTGEPNANANMQACHLSGGDRNTQQRLTGLALVLELDLNQTILVSRAI